MKNIKPLNLGASQFCCVDEMNFTTCSSADVDNTFRCDSQLPKLVCDKSLAYSVNLFYAAYSDMCQLNPSGMYIFDSFGYRFGYLILYSELCTVTYYLQKWKMENSSIVESSDYLKRVFSIIEGTSIFEMLDFSVDCASVLKAYSQLTVNVVGLLERMMRAEAHILNALSHVPVCILNV